MPRFFHDTQSSTAANATSSEPPHLNLIAYSLFGMCRCFTRAGVLLDEPLPRASGWLLLVYRVPSEPASKRVAIWRDVTRLGVLYLQPCVCILPRRPTVAKDLDHITENIPAMDGVFTLFAIPTLRTSDEDRIIVAFRELREKEYVEIVEECETKFIKDVEFEQFRENYTIEEAEEIGQDLDKIRGWFAAPGRDRVRAWLDRCQVALSTFEETVSALRGSDDGEAMELPGILSVVGESGPIASEKSIDVRGLREGKIT